jgi:hypothetical protein
MDDKYDTYKTANIEINQKFCFERLVIYLFFGTSSYTCEIYIFERVTQLAHPSALLCQSCRSYMFALEEMKKCTIGMPRVSVLIFI